MSTTRGSGIDILHLLVNSLPYPQSGYTVRTHRLLTALLNLFIGSASAKWALLAPILVPMLMLLGISAEMTTAAYRVGDGATNIITPLMVYFPLILGFAQRYQKDFGVGSLMAVMVPYSVTFLIAGMVMILGWTALDLPLGPGTSVGYVLPTIGAAATP